MHLHPAMAGTAVTADDGRNIVVVAADGEFDVAFVGEHHDSVAGHRLELHILEGLARRRGEIVLAMEMFSRDAQETLNAAWDSGVRYFDTAPLYGTGLSETRLNHFLRGKKRDDYALSTKVGRTLQVCPPDQRTGIGKFFDTPSRRQVYDYSYDGIMRSLEFSLERLGLDREPSAALTAPP